MRFVVASVVMLTAGAVAAQAQTYGFDEQKLGEPPKGITCALTGKARPGVWKILADLTAPSPSQVLAQADDDRTSYRFPVCVVDGVSASRREIAATSTLTFMGAGQVGVWTKADSVTYSTTSS